MEMENSYKKFNIFAAIIGFALIVTFIIVGSFLDYNISAKLYNPEETSLFGILGSVIAQAPTFMGVTFAGSLLLVISKSETLQNRKPYPILLKLAGIAVIALGTFFSFYYCLKLKDFAVIGKGTIYYISVAIGAVLFACLNALIVIVTLKNSKKIEFKRGVLVAFFILAVVIIEVILYQGLKIIVSRPRPKYIFSLDEPRRYYQDWWDLSHPFKAFIDENCKSCPSGHSANAMALPFIMVGITYLKKDFGNDIRVILFIIGYFFAMAWAFSRVYAGAHFLSDLGLGMLITFIVGVVIWNFFVYKYNINKLE